MVVHAVDGAGPAALHHAVLALHGGLRQPAAGAAVHLELREHGRGLGDLRQEGQPFPLALIQGLGAEKQPGGMFWI